MADYIVKDISLADFGRKELDIAESRRLKGLGERQQKALLERLG